MSEPTFYIHKNIIPPHEYHKVISFIELYKPSVNINYLIETYLVLKLLKAEKEFAVFKHLISIFSNYIKNFPESIFDINYEEINIFYRDVFWELLLFLNRLSKDDAKNFELYITKYKIQIIMLSSSSKLIQLFPEIVKNNFLSIPENIEFFLNHQKGKYIDSSNGLFIKLGVTNQDINDLAKRYCESDLANPNYLQSIVDYKKLSQYSFEDDVKLLSKRTIDRFWEEHFESNGGFAYSQGVGIAPLSDGQLYSFESKGLNYRITFNKTVLDENHDFSTLLNHFIYIFNFFDYDTGLPWLVRNQETFSFSKLFSSKSNADYTDFDDNLKFQYSLLFRAYFYYLKDNNIDLEEIIRWYFNVYLKEELGVQGFHFYNSNKESSYYERGKSVISEMDSILDQYEMFFKYMKIDPELLEMKSRSSSYEKLDSFLEKKFIKLVRNKENVDLFSMLFSNQSILSHIPSNNNIQTFFRHVQGGISVNDFDEYQKCAIELLIKKDIIEIVDEGGAIKFKNPREINILYKLWKTGTYCLFYRKEPNLNAVEQLVKKGICTYSNKLFSEAESNYLSYILDDKKYGNGLKIRNKFAHGKFSYLTEEQHMKNYLELLQILVFYVIRINDELDFFAESGKPITL
ncbi:hypothetical protein NWE22_09270 [Streptococcus parasuis]|uniref:hypothetical protein n=1 Tax=Streptococcus parasuis TaxID=1501662 RepID=UPI00240DCD77|nr:hypothetical protein [Streptococcus parasuis]MDG3213761.1 hypothetical protein [Streptococcus suis]WFB91787.1 hypothetical protein NWE22_09270 [Streptococcus parasuis]